MKNTAKYSKIIAGTMTWGKWGKQLSKKQMITLMQHCFDIGITTFDHADIYGDYTTEEQFGAAFSKSGLNRDKIQLISKCGIQFNAKGRDNLVKHYNYGKEYIIWSAERSIKELKTDYLDLLLLHRPSPLMHPDEIAEAVFKLKSTGKIKQFGVSNFTPSQIKLIASKVPVEANQIEFSLSANEVMADGTLDDCITHERMAMSWSPLGSFFRENNDKTKRVKKVLSLLKAKYNATEDQLLLAWLLKHPAKVHPVVGTSTPERLKLAVDAAIITMQLQDWFMLLEASQGSEVA